MKYYTWKWGFWVRVFGWFVSFQWRPGYEPIFSERYGYRKYATLGPFVLKWERDRDVTE